MTRNEYSKQSRCQGSWGVVQSTIKVNVYQVLHEVAF